MANNKIAFKYPAMHKEIAMPINPYLLIKYQVRIMFKKAEIAAIKTGVFVSFLAKKLGESIFIIIKAGIAIAYIFKALAVAKISD